MKIRKSSLVCLFLFIFAVKFLQYRQRRKTIDGENIEQEGNSDHSGSSKKNGKGWFNSAFGASFKENENDDDDDEEEEEDFTVGGDEEQKENFPDATKVLLLAYPRYNSINISCHI